MPDEFRTYLIGNHQGTNYTKKSNSIISRNEDKMFLYNLETKKRKLKSQITILAF